jgi:hypothetical protein
LGDKKAGEAGRKTSLRPKNGVYRGRVNNQTAPFSGSGIALQTWIRPALTPVHSNRDHAEFKDTLARMDASLGSCCLEAMAVEMAVQKLGPGAREQDKIRRKRFAIFAIRVEILRQVTGVQSFRAMSAQLAGNELMADFCGVRMLDGIRWTSKSTLDRASKLFSEEELRQLNVLLVEVLGEKDTCVLAGLEEAVDTSVVLVDSTCLEANVHYPVDWVLLRRSERVSPMFHDLCLHMSRSRGMVA